MKNGKFAGVAVIEEDVEMGEGRVLKEGVLIRSGTGIGKNTIIFPYPSMGREPRV